MYEKLLLSALLIVSTLSFAQTSIPPGNVSGTWTPADSPYQIQGEITIPNDSVLIIAPGTYVEFQGHYKLNVQGQLLAIGTDTNKITFTVPDSLQGTIWHHGIRFDSTLATNDTSKIIYCKLQYGNAYGGGDDDFGGAIFVNYFSKLLISNNIISYNSASVTGKGGGIYCCYSNPTLINNIISNNTAADYGGGIYCNNSSNPILINNIICNNSASDGGGGLVCSDNSNPTLINNTISNNSASNNGDGILCKINSNPTLTNTIFWGNSAGSDSNQVYLANDDCDPDFSYCNIQGDTSAFGLGAGTYTGTYTNNLNETPQFVSPSAGVGTGSDGVAADWSLQATSPCINAGTTDTTGLNLPATDLAGNLRIYDCTIDIGAYESQTEIIVSFTLLITEVCENSDTFELTGGSPAGGTYTGTGVSGENFVPAIATPGTHTITYVYGGSCNNSATQDITVNPTPVVDLGADQSACEGDIITLDADTGYTYLWSDTTTNQTLNVTVIGNYSVTITDGNGCTDTDDVIIWFYEIPTVDLGADTSACDGDTVTLDAGDGYTTYLWSDSTTNQTLNVTLAGNYSVTITDGNGCADRDSIDITINSNPVVDLGSDTFACDGDIVTLDAGIGYTYLWSDSTMNQTLDVTITENYSVTITDSIGCTGTDDIQITFNPNPTVNLGPDTSACDGDTVILDAGTDYSYLWTGDSTNQTLSVTTAGAYSVTITDGNGCTGTDDIQITFNAKPIVDLGNDTVFCDGSSITLDAGIGYSYYYNWNDSLSTNRTLTIDTAGEYYVQVSNICGSAYDTINVTLYPLPTVYLGKDTSFYEGNSITLDAGSGFVSYIWNDSTMNQTLHVTEAGTYYVIVTDTNGCRNKDEIVISVIGTEIIIYNALTPNGDGKNDTWYIENIDLYLYNTVEIYNTNGHQVFKTDNYQNNWDGKYNGKELPAGVYYYIIYLGHNLKVYKGGVTIIR